MNNPEGNACGSTDTEVRPHGLLPVNKPPGPSSFDCIRIIRNYSSLPRKWKIGHLGTLDPFASGVLVIALGQAVRYAEYGLHSVKKYRARLWLGDETDTLDPLGDVTETKRVPAGWKDQLPGIAKEFTGTISQVPPAFSAKQIDGRRSYKAARDGKILDLEPIEVEVKSLEFREPDENWVDFVVEVSGGTYIRALGRDIAKALGTVGHLIGLERISAGPFTIDEAISLESIKAGCTCAFGYHLQPVDRILSHLPECIISKAAIEKLSHGRKLVEGDFEGDLQEFDGKAETVRIHDSEGNFRALGRVKGSSIVPFKPWDVH